MTLPTAVLGSGAIGTVVAARLAHAGHAVAVIRNDHITD
jgi:ketopantoate reductase